MQVRDEDKHEVRNWALCCLNAQERGWKSSLSPNIDNLEMAVDPQECYGSRVMSNIFSVVRKFGEQELPVVSGKSWNKTDPLLLGGDTTGHDFSDWYGLVPDETPSTVYFVHRSLLIYAEHCDLVLALEVNLNTAYSSKGRIGVVRKVLKAMDCNILARCRFVTVPWLCDWE